MSTFLLVAASVLVLNVVVSAVRVLRGPSTRDRTSALLLLSTTGAAVLLVLGAATGVPTLRDAALALVALSAVTVLVRVSAERGRR
ncbi:monovalent cation/H+ antiporter complex subunit F [Cellulomonas triticagri]|uniref:Uncharacterized protein n=1 Tax=Cellulomonas triticagri TaxID=2483352 RepID=A0A3M2J7U9_9CELL|nr:monovalent cation/H+ antiporter complex subunit F [Cellulomonas triticagri]RMI08954.1 hypothetical protein EBM89_12490 [Cellulomonas triticagri]